MNKLSFKKFEWFGERVAFLVLMSLIIAASGVYFVSAGSNTTPVTGKATILNSNSDLDFNTSPYHSNVSINTDSFNFSGYAWSNDLGWVDFGTTDNSEGPVKLDISNGKITGKAKVLSTGNYIDFNPVPYNSNVKLDASGDFNGVVWSEDIGWIDFTYNVKASGLKLVEPSAPADIQIYDVSDRDLKDYALLVRWKSPIDLDPNLFKDYAIMRSDDGVNFTQVAQISGTTYYDDQVENGKTYYYKVKNENKTGTFKETDIVHLIPTGRYTTPPKLVSGPESSASSSTAEMDWVTDRDGSSFVKILENGKFVSEQGSNEQKTSHKVKVYGLKPLTSYTYIVESTDVDGNTMSSEAKSITTANTPSVYSVDVTNQALTSIVLSFKSTSIANFIIYYGKTASYGSTVDEASGSKTTNHSLLINNLEPGTLYYYRILGQDDSGNELKSENSFSTLPMPTATHITIQPVKDASVSTYIVGWITNVPTTSIVNYQAEGGKANTQSSPDLITDHSITIEGLQDNAKYSLSITGRDQFGNSVSSPVQPIITPLDTRPPKITDLTTQATFMDTDKDGKTQIVVSWKTDEAATSQVEIGQGTGSNYTINSIEDPTLTNNHTVIVGHLNASSPYHLRAISKDPAENKSNSDDQVVVTSNANKSILNSLIKTLGQTFGWAGKYL